MCYKGLTKKRSIVNNNGIKTTGLRISELGISGSSLRLQRATEKRSIVKSKVDDNGVGTTRLGISELGVTDLSLHCEREIEKRSIIDTNGVETTGLEMSGLGETSSSLHYNRRPQCCWDSSNSLFAYFWVDSSILLCWHCILFF